MESSKKISKGLGESGAKRWGGSGLKEMAGRKPIQKSLSWLSPPGGGAGLACLRDLLGGGGKHQKNIG